MRNWIRIREKRAYPRESGFGFITMILSLLIGHYPAWMVNTVGHGTVLYLTCLLEETYQGRYLVRYRYYLIPYTGGQKAR